MAGGIPDTYSFVGTRSDDARAIGAEGGEANSLAMHHRDQRLARGGIPNTGCAVGPYGEDSRSVTTELSTRHATCVPKRARGQKISARCPVQHVECRTFFAFFAGL